MRSSSLLLLLSACNLAPKTLDTDSGTTPDDTATNPTSGATIFDIRDGVYGDGEQVTLDGVVVVTPHTRDGEGLFIQDPAGGAKSGLYVWAYEGVADVFAEPGDQISVVGTVTDFYGWTEFVIASADAITITGTAAIPAPVALGDGAGVNWDDYESVAVTVTNQTVISEDEFGAGYLSGGLKLDDGIARVDYSCRGTFASLTGIIFYTYEEYSINPRTEEDGAGYTEGEAVATSIFDVRSGTECGPVALTDVVATTDVFEDADGAYFFAQDVGGGPYSSLVVFIRGGTAEITAGWQGAVVGIIDEYYGLTELVVDDPTTLVRTGTGIPVASVLTAPPADWEEYESCLVTLQDVTVTSNESYGQVSTSYAGLYLDDLLYDFSAAKGDVWASVTGPVWYSYDEWKLVPRSADDLR